MFFFFFTKGLALTWFGSPLADFLQGLAFSGSWFFAPRTKERKKEKKKERNKQTNKEQKKDINTERNKDRTKEGHVLILLEVLQMGGGAALPPNPPAHFFGKK